MLKILVIIIIIIVVIISAMQELYQQMLPMNVYPREKTSLQIDLEVMCCICSKQPGTQVQILSGCSALVEMKYLARYLGDVISCGGGVESAVRDRMSCAWSKWRELASLLVNYSILLEERVKVYCTCVRPALLYEYWKDC